MLELQNQNKQKMYSGETTPIRENVVASPIERKRVKRIRRIWMHRWLYLLMLPGVLYFLVFAYMPMWGVIIAFQDFQLWNGLFNSPWVGFQNFSTFFTSPYFVRLMRNTLIISGLDLVFVMTAPILFALLLNEIQWQPFKKVVQTISYLPHFISWVVAGGIVINLFSTQIGIVNIILSRFNLPPLEVIGRSNAFLPLLVGTSIWKSMGWGAIIYLAAIAGISPELYEAAMVDGANRLQRIFHITLPGILPVIIIMLIFRVGDILNVNFQQILILMGGDASLYEVGDVIQTYVYRVGFFQNNMSLATAVGLFQGVIGLVLIWLANRTSNRLTETGLW